MDVKNSSSKQKKIIWFFMDVKHNGVELFLKKTSNFSAFCNLTIFSSILSIVSHYNFRKNKMSKLLQNFLHHWNFQSYISYNSTEIEIRYQIEIGPIGARLGYVWHLQLLWGVSAAVKFFRVQQCKKEACFSMKRIYAFLMCLEICFEHLWYIFVCIFNFWFFMHL